MKKTVVLGVLFILPLVVYLFFASGVTNFGKLPILNPRIDWSEGSSAAALEGKISLIIFLGDAVSENKGYLFNFNQKIYKRFSEYECEARRYHNEFDYVVHRDRTFNKAAIFSSTQDSGNLELDYNTGQISLISKYPITNPDNKSQKILVTNYQDKYTINYFYNRVLINNYNNVIRKWDTLQITRLNTTNVVKFSGKNTLEYLSGVGLTVQLTQDKDTHFRFLVNILVSKNG
jgi:hypothetical protein